MIVGFIRLQILPWSNLNVSEVWSACVTKKQQQVLEGEKRGSQNALFFMKVLSLKDLFFLLLLFSCEDWRKLHTYLEAQR